MADVIRHARIPIIKGVERPFGFHIDINMELGAFNVDPIPHLFARYPALLMFGKLFLFQHRLDEQFHGGNTLQHMALFTIQASPGPPNASRAAFAGVLQEFRPTSPPGSQHAAMADWSPSSALIRPI
jgi:hypothetical protein